MTHSKLILMAGVMVLAFSVGGEVEAKGKPKNVNVVNEPNVSVLNNVDVNVTNDENNPVPVTVQNGNNTELIKEIIEITATRNNSTRVGVYTVPTGKRLMITDVVIMGSYDNRSFPDPSTCCAIIFRDTVGVSLVDLIIRQYQQKYTTGIEFNEGEIVGVAGQSGANQVFFELRGYLTDVN